MIPIFISIAQTYSDLKKYKEAIVYFKKELDCRKDEPEQVWLTVHASSTLYVHIYEFKLWWISRTQLAELIAKS